jgi:KipI family sensor histidine kinase inhibitor
MELKLKPYGESGILAYHLDEGEREELIRATNRSLPSRCVETVEGYDTLLFLFEKNGAAEAVWAWAATSEGFPAERPRTVVHRIPVIYDGPDLEYVAEKVGLPADEVVRIHSDAVYSVRMMGFAPGFPYLDGLDPRLHLPRKDSPRNRIEPGSIAIGGPHAGVYSVASPGGWHLLGRTTRQLFDPDAARKAHPDSKEVFLFSSGDQICFKPAKP